MMNEEINIGNQTLLEKGQPDDFMIINIGIEIIVNERSNLPFQKIKSNLESFITQTPNKENEIINSLFSNNFNLEKTVTYYDYDPTVINNTTTTTNNSIINNNQSIDYYKTILLGCFNNKSGNIISSTTITIPITNYKTKYQIFIYKLSNEPPQSELSDDTEQSSPYQQLILPNKSIETLWENLIYEDGLKSNLLSYMSTLILFSKFKIDTNIITNNKVIFLYGEPGTGKTSLAKALAQRISIVYRDRYQYSQLIEINTHSLFSKWFSESGKLVMKMFENIKELLEDQQCFIMILIDEVESLASARSSAVANGTEPSDSIRVVNAFLTQLDQLKQYSNVLIVATSNITKAVDLAFIDRADIKQYIGPPSHDARKFIFQTIITELSNKGIIIMDQTFVQQYNNDLDTISKLTENYSGRAIRKLPTIALSSHISFINLPLSITLFMKILISFIEKNNQTNNKFLNQ